MHRFSWARDFRLTPIAFALVLSSGCAPEVAECQRASDCGAATAVCAGCPDVPETHCRLGTCVDVEAASIDIVGDVNLHRDIASEVDSIVHILAHVDGADEALTCENVWDESQPGHVAARVNVVSSGYKSLQGGSYHPDLNFGRAPEGSVALLVVATTSNAGEGNVVATGCDLDYVVGSILNVDP